MTGPGGSAMMFTGMGRLGNAASGPASRDNNMKNHFKREALVMFVYFVLPILLVSLCSLIRGCIRDFSK